MNKTAKYLMSLGAGGAVAVTITLVTREAGNSHAAAPEVPAAALAHTTLVGLGPAASPVPPIALRSADAAIIIPPLPANATTVPDEDLLKLSALVDVPNAADRSIDKDRWTQVIPIAEKLVQGPCDCEQRNWLNHFIAMGKAARAGSDEQYYQIAGVMPKLARNDKQLADDPVRSLR